MGQHPVGLFRVSLVLVSRISHAHALSGCEVQCGRSGLDKTPLSSSTQNVPKLKSKFTAQLVSPIHSLNSSVTGRGGGGRAT